MGRRFLATRYPLHSYSPRRAWLRLHEDHLEPHRMRPYGLASGKCMYRQLFQKKHQSRQGNRTIKRVVKKAARQQGRRNIWGEGAWFHHQEKRRSKERGTSNPNDETER